MESSICSNNFNIYIYFLKGGLYLINWVATKYDFLQAGVGISQFLIFLDRGGRWCEPISNFWLKRGEGRS